MQYKNHREDRNIEGESIISYLEILCHKSLQLYQLIPPELSAKLIRINHTTFTCIQADVDHRKEKMNLILINLAQCSGGIS